MNPVQKRIKLIIAAIIFGGICLVSAIVFFLKEAHYTQNFSAMDYVYVECRAELDGYYQGHGCYPSNLYELNINSFGDGSYSSMLTNFYYHSGKTNFLLSWKTLHGQEFRLEGNSGRITFDGMYPP